MQCPQCELENEAGALYCARCHAAMPRPLAPGECRFCGRVPESYEVILEICPECKNNAERGAVLRKERAQRFLVEAEMQAAATEAQWAKGVKRGISSCLPLLLIGFFIFTLTIHIYGK